MGLKGVCQEKLCICSGWVVGFKKQGWEKKQKQENIMSGKKQQEMD